MQYVTDDEMIADIQRVARLRNTSQLSLKEYLEHGGNYSADVIDDVDGSGFANKCQMAGVKVKEVKKE